MTIPKTVNIKGHDWVVIYKPGLKDAGKMRDGVCDWDKRIIYIRKELKKEKKWPVFIHELIHAILYESFLSDYLPDANEYMIEEMICDHIESELNRLFSFKWRR